MNDPRIPQLREQYQAQRSALFDDIMAGGSSTRGIQTQLRKLSQLADGLLRDLWHLAGLPGRLNLVGVGGFGRGKLFPYSDIDVLLLLPEGKSAFNANWAAAKPVQLGEAMGSFSR